MLIQYLTCIKSKLLSYLTVHQSCLPCVMVRTDVLQGPDEANSVGSRRKLLSLRREPIEFSSYTQQKLAYAFFSFTWFCFINLNH